MTYLTEFIQAIYNYLYTLIGLDFSDYTGNLPTQLIEMYSYVEKFFQLLVIAFFVYLVFNFIFFLVNFGRLNK